MKPPFRSHQEIIIQAPIEKVWEFNQDLNKIAEFHPRVNKVDLLSGKARRDVGVAYQCHLKGGLYTCVEKDIEIVPMQKIVTILPEDSFGISKILDDYTVETLFTPIDSQTTRMEFNHYYSTRSIKAKLLNLIARRKIARESLDTLKAIKRKIEGGS